VKYLPVISVVLLMVSTGMSLDRQEFIANWRRLTPRIWARLLLATFIVPLALVLGRVLPIDLAAMGGLSHCGCAWRTTDDTQHGKAFSA
jgi:predicted Na+-dependent transporter